MMEAIRAPFEQKNSLGALANHAVSGKRRSEEERLMCAERTVTVRQTTLRDALECIPGLIEDSTTALITYEGQNGTGTINTRLEAMLQSLINKAIDENLNFVKFNKRSIC